VPLTDSLAVPGTDSETLEELLEQVRPRLKQVLKKYAIPFQDAEDLLQEAVLDLLRKWDTVRTKDAWLVGTLRFKCSDYWKRKRMERVQAFDLPELSQISPPQAPEQERTEVLHDLRHLVRFGLGLSSAEVATRLGYCTSSIRKLAARSLARLQRWAADAPSEPGDPGRR
jgi:RNA polymerase sigma factor (sigma-70 family)